ncbi:protein kinase domain-containing protein [Dictyobacter arantiisoli]|uniref:non-specific serine/threonine protein kinase n=1 Tax=Dictyobacter arantiisoli TaxID=2014874 RepID=A0A5A5TIE4_9CHLR|nr:protein kinase [Dictyobacter arantiisoli]GCF11092.1 hypothetical protein KDI_46560 [Dictyobacter arantiisoli]
MADLEGRTLDRYELQQLTGRGGMADVYLAYDPDFERDVAVKVFKREDEALLRRFVREAQLMASLHNAHLMPVYDTGTCRIDGLNVYYIVMPFMDGGTLRARIRRTPISLKQACKYLRDIADALDYMHQQGIIHRDIKASNILLDADGRCYLADFGIARSDTESTQLTSTGNVLGTVDYIAPELFESDYRADPRSDYYSLGVLLFEMVTGHLPFTAENQIAVVAMHVNKQPPSPRTFVPTIPPAVERVILRALEKRPELRYGSARELADAFYRAIMAPQTEETMVSGAQWPQDNKSSTLVNTGRQSVPLAAYPAAPPPAYPSQSSGYYDAAVPNHYSAQVPAYPAQYPRKNKAARTQAWIVTVLAIVALLAVAVPMAYAVMSRINNAPVNSIQGTPGVVVTPDLHATSQAASATAVQQAQATATAQTQATATAQANVQAKATATAQAKATATVQAQAKATATASANATATPAVIQTITAQNPNYTDPLTSATNAATQAAQWDQNTSCSFYADGYHVSAGPFNAFSACHEAATSYTNFAVQVDASIQSGHSAGLFFRMNTNPLQGYLFEIDNQGQYKISVSSNYDLGSMDTLRDWAPSSALKTGTTSNHLQVVAHNGTLLFYINGVYLPDPINDTTISSGNIGFLATWENGARARVVYSNLSVYTTA